MALLKEGLAVENAQRNGVALEKITVNGLHIVWEAWKHMVGEIFKFSATITSSHSSMSGDTTVFTSIIRNDKPVRKLKGTMNISGSGGSESAQFGYGVRFYTDSKYREYVETPNAYITRGANFSVETIVSFQSPEDIDIYGVSYFVWTWNGGGGSSGCYCTGARVTEWVERP